MFQKVPATQNHCAPLKGYGLPEWGIRSAAIIFLFSSIVPTNVDRFSKP